jgi:hypothetical protein
MRTPRRGRWASTRHTERGKLAVLGGGELFEDDGVGGGALDLPSLSHRFGEVQKFATHRVVDYQGRRGW